MGTRIGSAVSGAGTCAGVSTTDMSEGAIDGAVSTPSGSERGPSAAVGEPMGPASSPEDGARTSSTSELSGIVPPVSSASGTTADGSSAVSVTPPVRSSTSLMSSKVELSSSVPGPSSGSSSAGSTEPPSLPRSVAEAPGSAISACVVFDGLSSSCIPVALKSLVHSIARSVVGRACIPDTKSKKYDVNTVMNITKSLDCFKAAFTILGKPPTSSLRMQLTAPCAPSPHIRRPPYKACYAVRS